MLASWVVNPPQDLLNLFGTRKGEVAQRFKPLPKINIPNLLGDEGMGVNNSNSKQ